jgi:RimJ/RimL family protein N-acetyltransferase
MIVTGNPVGEWVSARLHTPWNKQGDEAIGLRLRSRIVAGVIYENWNDVSCVCHIAIDGPLTPAYLAAIFHYPFIYGELRKIIAPVNQENAKSVRFVRKLGFNLEAQILDASPEGSILLYTMRRDECRFLGERYGQKIQSTRRA